MAKSESKSRDSPSRESKQDRKFVVELYPDAEDYNCTEVLSIIEGLPEYAYILHDKDTDDNGELKKPHYHVVLRYPNPRSLSTVSNQLGINSRYLQICKKFKAALKYLVHRTSDSSGKYQYDPTEVTTNLSSYLYDVGACNECTALSIIYQLLDTGKYTLPQLARYLATNYNDPAIYSAFRRNFSILKAYEDEQKSLTSYQAFRQTYTPMVSVDMNLVNELMSKGDKSK